jgi:RNA polymerase sigma-70 factor, ECF subfamily
MPDEPEAVGLLALMLLSESRRSARTAADGTMVRLADQDRNEWDRAIELATNTIERDFLIRQRAAL